MGSEEPAAKFSMEVKELFGTRSGREAAAIRKSLVKGPNSTVPGPESVLKSILKSQAPVSDGTQNVSSPPSPASIREGAPRGCACVPSIARISPLISHKSRLDSFVTSIVTSRISSSSSSISSTTAHRVAVTLSEDALRCAMIGRHVTAT